MPDSSLTRRPSAAMIFAAGFGTRMGLLTKARPKPLIEVGGTTLIDRAIALTRAAGIERIVANTHYLADQMGAHLTAHDIAVSHEAPTILDTGGGLRQALPYLGAGPVFTLNPDAVWTGPNPLQSLAAAWEHGRMGALLMLVSSNRANAHRGSGDFDRNADSRLTRGTGYIYTGAQIVDPAGLDDIEEKVFSLNAYWNRLDAEGRLFGIVHPGGWCDVGTPDGIAAAEAMIGATGV